MISPPGARWRQLNGDRDDGRLWRDERFQDQAVAFWRDLTQRLTDHPAVTGARIRASFPSATTTATTIS
jgi:hypothetical protein